MQENKSTEKISEIMASTLEKIRTIADAETIIGEPIATNGGVTVIPVSKVSVGFASGGLDYSVKNEPINSVKPKNFGGGGGTGLTVNPVGFLVIQADGRVEMIDVGSKAPADPVGQITDIIDRSPEIIAKIKDIFVKKAPEGAESAE